ncbi:hypothetical protein PSYPI_39174, partial [Pseudomonas syringae pv. pisi str. 1704B]
MCLALPSVAAPLDTTGLRLDKVVLVSATVSVRLPIPPSCNAGRPRPGQRLVSATV